MKPALVSKPLLRILILAFVVRMAFFLALKPWCPEVLSEKIIISDAIEYNRLALSILETKSFVEFTGLRTPGYPLFIAFIYAISGNATWLVLLMQVLINLLSIVVLFKIAESVFSRRIAIISSFIFAIDLHQALFSVSLYSDSVYVFLLLLSVFFLIKGIGENRYFWIIASGIIISISALHRPVSTLLPGVFAFFLIFFSRLKLSKAI